MRYVSLLRGVNVGGNARVEMSRLKKVLEKAGFTDVVTYINSGNVIFDAPKGSSDSLVATIEKMILQEFGFSVPAIVLEKRRFLSIERAIPKDWSNDTNQRTDVLFLWKSFDSRSSLSLISPTKGVDTLKYIPGALAWNMDRKGYSRTGMRKFIGTPLYKNMTARNVNTVRKLAGLLEK